MKNVLHQKPNDEQNARQRVSLAFVDNSDIKNKDILDIGCGFGWCELDFLNRGAKTTTGIELSDEDLVAARGGIQDKRATFLTGSAIELPFADNSFDTVVSWEVLEHIPKNTEHLMFSEIARVLRPGGSLYLSTPYAHPFAEVFDPAWWFGHRHYTKKQLRTYSADAHFNVDNLDVRGGYWTVLAILNMYISKWLLRRPMLFFEFFTRKESEEYDRVDGIADIFLQATKKEKTALNTKSKVKRS